MKHFILFPILFTGLGCENMSEKDVCHDQEGVCQKQSDTYVTLNNGERMPLVGLGTSKSKPEEVEAAVKTALEIGYRHFDCAPMYRNERHVGNGLKHGLEVLNIPRKDLFIVSKLGNSDHGPEDVEPALRKTLKSLRLSYLDLYLIHWPTAYKKSDGTMDPDSDPTKTWLAMERLVQKGLVKSIGVSNFNSKQILDILDNATILPVTNQVECHPFFNQNKLKRFCEDHGIVLTAYSPFGSPDRQGIAKIHLLEQSAITDIAEHHGRSPAQVILRWQIQRGVLVIPKSVTPSRIRDNISIFDFALNDTQMAVIDSLNMDRRLIDAKFYSRHPDYPFHIEF